MRAQSPRIDPNNCNTYPRVGERISTGATWSGPATSMFGTVMALDVEESDGSLFGVRIRWNSGETIWCEPDELERLVPAEGSA